MLAHERREPWQWPGGTTLVIVRDGIDSGIRLFEGVDTSRVALEQVSAESSQRVTHLTYAAREG